MIFTPGAAGTSNICTNGSGITLTDTTQQFPISNLSVDFVGTQTSPSSAASGSAATSGSGAASSSSTASAKSGAGTIRFDYGIMVLIVSLSMCGLVVLVM